MLPLAGKQSLSVQFTCLVIWRFTSGCKCCDCRHEALHYILSHSTTVQQCTWFYRNK